MAASAPGAAGALPGRSKHATGGWRGRRTGMLAAEIVKSVDRRTAGDGIAESPGQMRVLTTCAPSEVGPLQLTAHGLAMLSVKSLRRLSCS